MSEATGAGFAEGVPLSLWVIQGPAIEDLPQQPAP
jgi:hypothetical protein